MKESSAASPWVIVLAGTVALGSLAFAATFPEAADAESMSFWEAYDRGLLSLTMEERTYQRGEDTVTLPVGIRVENAGEVSVVLEEEAVLMSPHSLEPPASAEEGTTQDAVLPPGSIPARGSRTFFYGEDVLRGFLPEPAWWCAEEFQFTRAGVSFVVGGETLPFDLRSVVANRHYDGPEANTQADLWVALRTAPAVVAGKTPLWTTVDAASGERIPVALRATNLAVYTFDDDVTADVNATAAILEDVVPAGWSVEEGSPNVAPDEVVENGDGSRTLRWTVDAPAALESEAENPIYPTEYETVLRSYVLVTPDLAAGRVELPRARVDLDADGSPESHSAPPVVDAEPTDRPPVADAGGPYGATEGEEFLLSAAASADPDGEALEFRWDLRDDGAFDTPWSSSPEARVRYTDDFEGYVRVEVRDATQASSARARVEIANAAPEILRFEARADVEFRLFLAGERWHDARLRVLAGSEIVGEATATREPSATREQVASTGPLDVALDGDLRVEVVYDPGDDRVHGAFPGDNPAWLVVVLPDGRESRFFHNFNVRRESTWTWTLADLAPVLLDGVRFEADLRDDGSDDLEVVWSFGDGGSASQTFYNDGMGPDGPDPLGGTSPFEVQATASHGFAAPGVYEVRIEVRDDDGGSVAATLRLDL